MGLAACLWPIGVSQNPRAQHFAGRNMRDCSFGTYPEQEYFAHLPSISDKMVLGGAHWAGYAWVAAVRYAGLAVFDSACRIFCPKTPKLTVRGRWSRSRRVMHSRRESATWGFTGNAGRKSFERSRKPLFAPCDLPYIVRLCVFAPNFRQDSP